MASAQTKKDLVRDHAENDLAFFINLVHPGRVLGNVHRDVISWWERQDHKSHQLLLLPRDHQKSAMIAYRVAWYLTKDPTLRILYISSTSNLAVKQLKFIKDILTSPIYRYYWPEMVNEDEGKREKWTETEISIDHPRRKAENIRDPSIFTAGLTTTITGLHCDISVLDDVVIDDNAYEESAREQVRARVSYLASIGGTDSLLWAVGTRYHPKDLYNDLLSMTIDLYNEEGELIDSEHLYEVYERQVETNGDGTGEFLWPRMQRKDGKWFGFDARILAKKKAQYLDQVRFRAQYYNDPNDTSTAGIPKETFQYYDRKYLTRNNGYWYFKDKRLNVFASIDFAYSTSKQADFTCICVIGIDAQHNIYVLEIDRFKTSRISEYFDRLLRLHTKWDFRKVRAEVTAAQSVIVEDLRNNYIRPNGLALSIDPVRPMKKKEERIEAILQPRYTNLSMWHYQGGYCELLEEELVLQNPPHDDIKDALASAVEVAVPPSFMGMQVSQAAKLQDNFHPRFGGIN